MDVIAVPSLSPPSPVALTLRACQKLDQVIQEQGGDLYLRLAIQGGGCSGLQYVFELGNEVEPEDLVAQSNGVTWVVDPISAHYLQGAEVDYEEGLSGAQFVVRNPNAKTTCGCGSSFTA